MPLDRRQLAALMQNPAAMLNEAMQAEIAAAQGKPAAKRPGMTLADIENELRQRARTAEQFGDRTIVATTEAAIKLNREFMQGVVGGLVGLQNQVDELRDRMDNQPPQRRHRRRRTPLNPPAAK